MTTRLLDAFYQSIPGDPIIGAYHVSMYMAFLWLWEKNSFIDPLYFKRSEIMKMAKIGSRATYHKCLRDLNERKYVKYVPSFRPGQGSQVYLK